MLSPKLKTTGKYKLSRFLLFTRFQAETFAKPVTDGASAARRHFEKSVMLCLISNLATSRRRSILGFRLLLGVLQRFQPENRVCALMLVFMFVMMRVFVRVAFACRIAAIQILAMLMVLRVQLQGNVRDAFGLD